MVDTLNTQQTIQNLELRLDRIREIVETVDNRAMACDGPVPTTLEEMTQSEISEIFTLAGGKPNAA